MPQRIQLSRAKGFRLPKGAVNVARPSKWGNPYRIGDVIDMRQVKRWGWNFHPQSKRLICKDAVEAVRRFAVVLAGDEAIHDYVREQLGGKDLACWCDLDQPCHADALLALANGTPFQLPI